MIIDKIIAAILALVVSVTGAGGATSGADAPNQEPVPVEEPVVIGPATKFMINFEGRIVSIDGDRVTLDSGKVLILTDETVYSIPQGVVESVILTEGAFIQGYTADDPEAAEIVAGRVHVTPL